MKRSSIEKVKQAIIDDLQYIDDLFLLEEIVEIAHFGKKEHLGLIPPSPAAYTVEQMQQRMREHEADPNPVFISNEEAMKRLRECVYGQNS